MTRKRELYITDSTMRRLMWIQQLKNERPPPTIAHRTVTADEIGDLLLNKAIEAEYPNIAELEKQFDKSEDELLAKLAKGRK